MRSTALCRQPRCDWPMEAVDTCRPELRGRRLFDGRHRSQSLRTSPVFLDDKVLEARVQLLAVVQTALSVPFCNRTAPHEEENGAYIFICQVSHGSGTYRCREVSAALSSPTAISWNATTAVSLSRLNSKECWATHISTQRSLSLRPGWYYYGCRYRNRLVFQVIV